MKRFAYLITALAAPILLVAGCTTTTDTGAASSATATAKTGHWDAHGQPVNGGPIGADGSSGNNLTQEHCARNEDPACPKGSYVGPNAQRDPRGGPGYVKCEGTICTNPNHGAGTDPRTNGGDDSVQPQHGGN